MWGNRNQLPNCYCFRCGVYLSVHTCAGCRHPIIPGRKETRKSVCQIRCLNFFSFAIYLHNSQYKSHVCIYASSIISISHCSVDGHLLLEGSHDGSNSAKEIWWKENVGFEKSKRKRSYRYFLDVQICWQCKSLSSLPSSLLNANIVTFTKGCEAQREYDKRTADNKRNEQTIALLKEYIICCSVIGTPQNVCHAIAIAIWPKLIGPFLCTLALCVAPFLSSFATYWSF